MPTSKKRKKKNIAKPLFSSPKTQNQIFHEKLDIQKEEINKQRKDLDDFQNKFKNDLASLSKNHSNHLSLLSNFARHDLKNYIHSIDGIVSTCKADSITDEQLESIKLNVKFIRDTLDEFSKLVVHNEDSICEFSDLVTAIKIINRDALAELKIDFEVDNSVDVTFHIPFQTMFQLLNNLIVNAMKALEALDTDNKLIELKAYVEGENLVIKVSDNGQKIESSDSAKLFEYGFSTTDGTGIGLYHANMLCTSNSGSILYSEHVSENFNKCFIINLPLRK